MFNRFEFVGLDDQQVDDAGGGNGEDDGNPGLEALSEYGLFRVRFFAEAPEHEPREAKPPRRGEIEHEDDGSVGKRRAIEEHGHRDEQRGKADPNAEQRKHGRFLGS